MAATFRNILCWYLTFNESTIKYFTNNIDEAKEMGENGRRAILEEFNWGIEEKKLVKLYNQL